MQLATQNLTSNESTDIKSASDNSILTDILAELKDINKKLNN